VSFQAPEVYIGQTYTEKADVYSYAICLAGTAASTCHSFFTAYGELIFCFAHTPHVWL
jgi:serine/threonine protein kinase